VAGTRGSSADPLNWRPHFSRHGSAQVTISIRRMSLGSGYKYLMESVVQSDGANAQSSPLTRYYAESGTPPGRFMGGGLAGLDDGNGVQAGSEVSEEMLFNMLGMCADPITGHTLGRSPNRWPKGLTDRVQSLIDALPVTLSDAERVSRSVAIKFEEMARSKTLLRPVAGFDLTFSVPKSISSAWAVADAGTQAVIYQAHQEAIRRTIAYAEEHTFFSRSGTNGVVQEQIRGVVAAGFDHWDSRSGDPQLHTHVVIQNRAQSLDGTWRTLDSRGLFKQVVTLSEMHKGILADLLTDSLGWGFDPRQRKYSDVPKYEVAGVSDELMHEFSARTDQIEEATNAQVAAYRQRSGTMPSKVVLARMRQKATLDTRPEKHHHSLAEQTVAWRERASRYVDDTSAWVESLRDRNDLPRLRADDFTDLMLRDVGRLAASTVAEKRATFTRANLLAEVHRQLHGIRFASPEDRISVAERTSDLALNESLLVSGPEMHHVPGRFLRADGTSKFRGRGTEIYTTQALLAAEGRLLAAGRATSGPVVDRSAVAAVADADLPGKAYGLSTDQAVAVESIATSGRALDVLVGPAGTGKSTSMAGLRVTWEQQYGPGSVIGLAPSAVAAEVLADELGIATENTAKWLTEAARQPERLAKIDTLRAKMSSHALGSAAHRSLTSQADKLADAHDRWSIKPGQLVIVDEASLAGTFALDALVDQANTVGAKVLLAGDWAQLSAVEAGGAFSMLVRDRDLAPELTDVRRFTNAWEKTASIQLRVGDAEAISTYTEHRRIDSGTRDELLAAIYDAWSTDVREGLTSLMIAGDLETVSELNRRARADRVLAGDVMPAGLDLAGGGVAGVGDRVVTRENNRLLSTGKRWVKNGDAWTVTATAKDGSMTVKREKGGGEVVLPADYVKDRVELGYASTAHRAQGRTVDTAHAMVTATTTREVLYVAATRGRHSNRLYVDTFYDPDHDTSHGPVTEQPFQDVLRAALANTGADTAAHTVIEHAMDSAESIPTLAAEYLTIARQAQTERWDTLLDTSGLTTEQVSDVRESEAYGPLLAALRDAEARGLDITGTFPQLVQGRKLDSSEDIASTLHERVDRWTRASASRRQGASQFVAGIIPRALNVTDADIARALTDRADAMNSRARVLAEQATLAGAAWIRQLGTPPAEPARREEWLREVSTVAAYRERWSVSGRDPVDAKRSSIERMGHEKRAEQAAERAKRIADGEWRQQATTRGAELIVESGVDQ
jgi:conjugative relaxase-like TrwC/TraI family protein